MSGKQVVYITRLFFWLKMNKWMLLISIVGFALIMIGSSQYGIGITTDSINYISAGENIAGGNGFEFYNGDTFHEYAPLLPLLLSIPFLLGISPEIFFIFLTVCCSQ